MSSMQSPLTDFINPTIVMIHSRGFEADNWFQGTGEPDVLASVAKRISGYTGKVNL